MGRAPCCEKMGLKKGPWTPEEDQILINYINLHGHTNWRALPKHAGLLRCGKSCRLRWTNYLRPDIKRGNFTQQEEETIIKLHERLGNRWSAIAASLPGRTDNEIKNVWHTHLKKRLPEHNQTIVEPVKRRARKSKAAKKSEIPEKSGLDHVNYTDSEENNNNSNSNSSSNNVGSRPTSPTASEPNSPQPCSSSSDMSWITSTSSSASDNDAKSKENVEDKDQIISDDFWMQVLSLEDSNMSPDEDLPCIAPCPLTMESNFESNSEAYSDDMEFFWYNLLTRSTDLPELSEML